MAVVARNKLRLFLVDEQNNTAAKNVRVEAIAEVQDDKNVTHEVAAPRSISLGLLQSDHTGFVAFDMSPAAGQGKITRLLLRIPSRTNETHDLTDQWDSSTPAVSVSVMNAAALADTGCTLPSVQNPDATDWTVSPRSFGSASVEVVGQDGCETLLVSNAALQTFRFVQTVREAARMPDLVEPADAEPCDPKQGQSTRPALCYRRGAILEYVMEWRPMGHALGQVLYSLPLAPCETVKVAIIDWSRNDETARSEDSSVEEQLIHQQRRDRAVEETVQAALSEWQRGGSVMGAAAGAASGGSYSVAASLGAGYFTSAGDRNIAADTVQRLSDLVQQATTSTRRLQSTVVVQASQRENERLETRTVTNHNHCHALTILYYEVVRHFVTSTTLVNAQDALLLRPPELEFDRQRAAREQERLRPILLDRRLVSAFDSLNRVLLPAHSAELVQYGRVHSLTVTIRTGEEDSGALNSHEEDYFLLVLHANGTISQMLLRDFMLPRHGGTPWLMRRNMTNTFVIPFNASSIRDVRRIGVRYTGADQHWSVAALEALASVDVNRGQGWNRELVSVVQDDAVNHVFTDLGEWWTDLDFSPDAGSDRYWTDEAAAAELIAHLNLHRYEYNRAVWLNTSPEQWASLLDQYYFEHDGRSGRLLDFVGSRIVDVVGDYVVFPIDGRTLTQELVPQLPEPVEQISSLPVRGVFAEAKLSNCNGCEEIDDTRFWDWQQSPCSDEAPTISPLSADSRARDVSATPEGAPSPSIGVEAPPEAPEPSAMESVLDTLGRSNLFRDMSGRAELAGVMQHLIDGAVQLQMEQLRQNAQRQQQQARTNTSTPSTVNSPPASSSAAPRPSSADSTSASTPASAARATDLRYRQAHSAVDRGVRSQAITPAEADQQHRRLIEEQVQDTINTSSSSASTSGLDQPSAARVDMTANPAELRAFFPSTHGDSGQITLVANVVNAPADSTVNWSAPSSGGLTILNPFSTTTDVIAWRPGLNTLTCEVFSGLRRIAVGSTRICVPQFVEITENPAEFAAALDAFHLADRRDEVLITARQVVEELLRTVNVRGIWTLAPFNAVLPDNLVAASLGGLLYSVTTLRDVATDPSLSPGTTGETFTGPTGGHMAAGGTGSFGERIDIYTHGFLNDTGEIGRLVRALTSADLTDSRLLQLQITVVGRLLGVTIAHEILHAILGQAHTSTPNDLLNDGRDLSFKDRTGILIFNGAQFPQVGTYRDMGYSSMVHIAPATQMRLNQILPIPPAFQ